MAWRLAKSLVTLRQQVDAAHPKRSKKSDGTVGDLAHRARKSDHNPNSAGVVTAIDLTHDPQGGFDAHKLADHIRQMKDPRIKYIISNRRIASSTTAPWQWRKYSGSNPHTAHAHFSVSGNPKMYDSTGQWSIKPRVTVPQAGIADIPTPEPEPTIEGNPEDRCYWEDVADKGREESEGLDEAKPAEDSPGV